MSNNRMSTFLKYFTFLYFAAAFGLAIWGSIQGTGLPGWLIALELEKLGTASVKLTMLLSVILYCLPLLGVMVFVEKVAPGQFQALQQSLKEVTPDLDPNAPPRDTRPIKTWAGVGKLALVMIGITLVITGAVYLWNRKMESSDVRKFTTADLPAGKLPSWQRVELTGSIPRGFFAAFYEGHSNRVYLPVTAPGWAKDTPVQAFIHYQAYADPDDKISLPAELAPLKTLTAKGTVGTAIPVYAERMLRGQGLQIAADPLIVDWDSKERVPEAFPETALIALVLGGFITTICVGVFGIIKTGLLQPGSPRWKFTGFEGTWREETPQNARELSIYWGRDNALYSAQVLRHGDMVIRRPTPIHVEKNMLYLDTAGIRSSLSSFQKLDATTMRQHGGEIWKRISSVPG